MISDERIQEFEALTVCLSADQAPVVDVTAQVMRRIRRAQTLSERTLTLLAAGACAAAILVAMMGVALLSGTTDPLETVFEIIPPITL